MSEMIERVARAIYEKWAAIEDSQTTWEKLLSVQNLDGYPTAKKYYHMSIEEARAAIEAMREPTQEMEDAGWEQLPDAPDDWSPVSAYQRMIDEALK